MGHTISRIVKQWFLTKFHAVFSAHRLEPSILQNIPPELVENILARLEGVDQICFSLSCKYTFACFQSYAKRHEINVAKLLPPPQWAKFCGPSAIPRRTALLRLQDNRWKYCSQCESLHQFSMWRAFQSMWKFHWTPCYGVTGNWKCSSLYAGEVDICPCSRITFHQGQHIIGFLRDENDYSDAKDFLDSRHPQAKVRICSMIRLDFFEKNLSFTNEFHFEMNNPDCSYWKDLEYLDLHPGEWLRNFFDEASSGFYKRKVTTGLGYMARKL
ncbi:hypothetical protein N7492_003208 [Penicillium capsulatum]|uniref:F-box domain-containing protein n=1 Tax=Penicillium capsulatum TaxID=69766 RepID=A0A9W9IJ18_9EURO|nr:hypothetical protein N7492_003208 [Penicillium capsulatum]KAJ6122205.1 hypothetical protein N7512_004670 [Penicillium capsulatum]